MKTRGMYVLIGGSSVKNWKGLFRKERVLMRRGITVLAALHGIVVGLTLSRSIFGVPQEFFDTTLVLVGIWLACNMFIGVWMLYASLRHEMKQPDIWLHSSESMIQLVGAKAIFAAITTVLSLVLSGVWVGIAFYLSEANKVIAFSEGALSLLSVIIALFLYSIYVMALGFFFWSIYHVLRSRIGGLSVPATIAIFFAGAYVWEKLRVSQAIDTMKKFGPVKMTDVSFYNESNSYFLTGIVQQGVIFSVGSLLMYGTLTAVLFVVGSMLFEKKIRL